MLGLACGSSTQRKSCQRVLPNDSAASIICGLTWRMPSAVSRTKGAMAYTTVANSAGTLPMPNSINTGIRYTKLGMVCITSSTGESSLCRRGLRAIQMPNGMPIIMIKSAEAAKSANVCIKAGHRPSAPMV